MDTVASRPDRFPSVRVAGVSQRRLAIGFLNFAHALDHFVILIYPTVIIELQSAYGRSYSELIALGTASFTAFGLFSLPAGWLADRWSRRTMMLVFYIGCGVSLIGAAFAPSLTALAVCLFALGVFAAIYHPVGTVLILENAARRGRTLGLNAVCGNLGIALASGITAALTAAISWRGAFLVPGVVCLVTGGAYYRFVPGESRHAPARNPSADVSLPGRVAAMIFALFVLAALSAGLVTNTMILALPKIVDERIARNVSLVAVGGLTTGLFLCGAFAQIAFGRLAERIQPHILFVAVAAMQFAGISLAIYATGMLLLLVLAFTMAAVFGQITINDLVIAHYTADAWRGRVYAVRYLLTFMVSGASASMIVLLYGRGGFDLILGATAAMALGFLAVVLAIAMIAHRIEATRKA
jgi:predicted MFS family arabinose efflux permease